MDLCGSLWFFVDICGYLWIIVDNWIFVGIASSLIYLQVESKSVEFDFSALELAEPMVLITK